MYGSKHLTNVALFPLCDADSVLIDALCDMSDKPSTRGDALVFAWRLALPERIDVAAAANAVLVVALSVPRKAWNRQQLLIVRELMVLAGREDSMPARSVNRVDGGTDLEKLAQRRNSDPALAHDRRSFGSRSRKRHDVSKEAKPWWKLVGKDESEQKNRQRKTRKGRVSREPTPR